MSEDLGVHMDRAQQGLMSHQSADDMIRLGGKSCGYTVVVPNRHQGRRRKTAKRSLQKLFDAAATDSNERPVLITRLNERIVDDKDTALGSLTSSQTDAAFATQLSTGISEETLGSSSQDEESSRAMSAIPSVPIKELLNSERGSEIRVAEIKAMIYSIAEDLESLHSANLIHKSVTLESIVLQVSNGTGRSTLQCDQANIERVSTLGRAPQTSLESSLTGMNSYAAPETVYCASHSQVVTRKGNMWNLGCIVFELLSGGEMPFGEHGIGIAGGETLFNSIDRQQSWLKEYLNSKMLEVNRSIVSKGNEICSSEHLNKKRNPSMKAIGFDEAAVSLIHSLLHTDPAQRISATEVLEHPFLRGIKNLVPKIKNGGQDMGSHEGEKMSPSSVQEGWKKAKISPREEAGMVGTDESHSLAPPCPYPLIGHIKQATEIVVHGRLVKTVAIHAVYSVPGNGAMMSAKPVSILSPTSEGIGC